MRILLADDEKTITTTLADALEDEEHEVAVVHSGQDAVAQLKGQEFDVLITDVRMPGPSGVELLKLVKSDYPGTFVVVITGYGTIESAVEAMKLGAYDFVTKPFLNEEIVQILNNIGELTSLRRENERLKAELYGRFSFGKLIGKSEVMQRLFHLIESIAASDFAVLVTGERGTGKELVARAVHYNSPRKEGAFIAVNCGAIADSLIESELFGHKAGSFTDAREDRVGKFEAAEGGTIFLDEVTELRLDLQVRLLRVLNESEVVRVGENEPRPINVRVVAASNRDIQEAIEEGGFRADLYDRLNVLPLHLPPLRDRQGDVGILVQHFLGLHGGGRDFEIDPKLSAELSCYPWPGNVRELENTVKRLIALSAGETRLTRKLLEALPGTPFASGKAKVTGTPSAAGDTSGLVRTLSMVVEEAEKTYIQEILQRAGNQKTRAAEILGISRKNLWEKMKRYEIG